MSRLRRRPVDLPADRTVRVLVLGFQQSGKTTMLVSLYRHFAQGGPTGLRLATDDDSNSYLLGMASQIISSPDGKPFGTQPARNFSFGLVVESRDNQRANAFTIEYLDYAGKNLERILNKDPADPADEKFEEALKRADVLMGLLDGADLAEAIANQDPSKLHNVELLLNLLARHPDHSIHLVITKWDLVLRQDYMYMLSDARRTLENLSNPFKSFCHSPKGKNLRIVPIAALGTNGFLRFDEASGKDVRNPKSPWKPLNVEVPFLCAVPDIIRSDASKSRPVAMAKITLTVLGLVGVLVNVPGGLALCIPTADIAGRVMKYLEQRHSGSQIPSPLDERAAIGYVLKQCYEAAKKFDQRSGTDGAG